MRSGFLLFALAVAIRLAVGCENPNISTAPYIDSDRPRTLDTIPPAAVALDAPHVTDRSVILSWIAPGDDSTTGSAAAYEIRYTTFHPAVLYIWSDFLWDVEVVQNPPVPLPGGSSQMLKIDSLASSEDYYIAMKARDEAGNFSGMSNVVSVRTHPRAEYAPGKIIVGFVQGITEAEADSLVQYYGLSWKSSWHTAFAYWVEVVQGDPEDYLDDLNASELVSWAKHRGNPNGRQGAEYIVIVFRSSTIDSEARGLIDSFPGLVFSSRIDFPDWGTVYVPEGQEYTWIEIFETESIVEYAQLNYIYSPGVVD